MGKGNRSSIILAPKSNFNTQIQTLRAVFHKRIGFKFRHSNSPNQTLKPHQTLFNNNFKICRTYLGQMGAKDLEFPWRQWQNLLVGSVHRTHNPMRHDQYVCCAHCNLHSDVQLYVPWLANVPRPSSCAPRLNFTHSVLQKPCFHFSTMWLGLMMSLAYQWIFQTPKISYMPNDFDF